MGGRRNTSGGFAVTGNRDHLKFKFPRLGEGEAEGRFAITALVLTIVIRLALAGVLAAVAVSITLKVFLP
jgi:hypothetical protein